MYVLPVGNIQCQRLWKSNQTKQLSGGAKLTCTVYIVVVLLRCFFLI